MATQRLLHTTCQGLLGIVGQHTVTVIRFFHQCELKHLNTLWLTTLYYLPLHSCRCWVFRGPRLQRPRVRVGFHVAPSPPLTDVVRKALSPVYRNSTPGHPASLPWTPPASLTTGLGWSAGHRAPGSVRPHLMVLQLFLASEWMVDGGI